MLGRELRVSLAHRNGLRRLQETLRPLGIAFDLHLRPFVGRALRLLWAGSRLLDTRTSSSIRLRLMKVWLQRHTRGAERSQRAGIDPPSPDVRKRRNPGG